MTSFVYDLFRHRQLSARRDPMFGANRDTQRLVRASVGVLALMMCFSGVFFAHYARILAPDLPVVDAFNGMMVYMLVGSLFYRFFFPFNPAFDVLPYWSLPVPRKILFRYLVWTSFFSKGLLVWVMFLLSFMFFHMRPVFDGVQCALYAGCFLVLLVIRHFFFVNLRLLLRYESLVGYVLQGLVLAGLILGWLFLDLTPLSRKLGAAMTEVSPVLWISLCGTAILLVAGYARLLRVFLNEELQRTSQTATERVVSLRLAEGYGLFGKLIWFEVMKYVRNKRMVMALLSPVILLFMVIFVFDGKSAAESRMVPMFVVMGVSSIGQALRQYIFSAESWYFDGLMVLPGVVSRMLHAKFLVDVLVSLLGAMFFLSLVFLDRLTLIQWAACVLYAIGFHNLLPYALALVNRARIDMMGADMKQSHGLKGSQMFWNFALNMISLIAIIILLTVVPEPWNFVGLSGLGVAGLLLSRVWLRQIYLWFWKRRHFSLEGFRGV